MTYTTRGVCSRRINIDVEDGKIQKITFEGGCAGNTKGVAALAEGMEIDEAINRLSGIRCGLKATSCPDQLARALAEYKEKNA
ncbi:MAG: TIGR03905 family TSCPD domain-containing protein [Clostridia bacterium]|nr:TIGR03905 family TSCPD domain-containing protein [Clostridia bacterium]